MPPAGPSPTPRSGRSTWPAWSWRRRCGDRTRRPCPSSIRRRPAPSRRHASCCPTWARSTPAGGSRRRGGPWPSCRCTPAWPAWSPARCARGGDGRHVHWPPCWRTATFCAARPTSCPSTWPSGPVSSSTRPPPTHASTGPRWPAPAGGPASWPGGRAWPATTTTTTASWAQPWPWPTRTASPRPAAEAGSGCAAAVAPGCRGTTRWPRSRSWWWPSSTPTAGLAAFAWPQPSIPPTSRPPPGWRSGGSPPWCGTPAATTCDPPWSAASAAWCWAPPRGRPSPARRRPAPCWSG